MSDREPFAAVLLAFARTGFAKATMEELARAAGVSRQTLYNRHKTKEAVLTWAAAGFSLHVRSAACAALDSDDTSISRRLLAAFSERVGILVPMVHGSPHGAEILDLGAKLREAAPPDYRADFMKDLKLFLLAQGVCSTLDAATDMAFLLMMSAKGLLLNTRDRAAFDAGMQRIIKTALREPADPEEHRARLLEDVSDVHPMTVSPAESSSE